MDVIVSQHSERAQRNQRNMIKHLDFFYGELPAKVFRVRQQGFQDTCDQDDKGCASWFLNMCFFIPMAPMVAPEVLHIPQFDRCVRT